MSATTLNMTPLLYEYFQKNSLRESAILKKLRTETASMRMSNMQISPEQGQLMRLLVQLIGARKTLEIGVFTGYSALSVALALPEDGKIVACDVNREWTDIARRFWEEAEVSHKIDLYLAPALDTLESLLHEGAAETFDFAFIDADKANYINYYEKTLQLLRRGGLAAIDNVLWGGAVADPKNHDAQTILIRELNQKLLTDDRVDISMLPIGDGLTLVRKK